MGLEDMADETVVEESFDETPAEGSVAPNDEEVVDYSEVEQEAMKHGWRPDGVDGKRNLSAEEFMDRKPLFDRMHKQDKKIKQLEEGLNAALEHDQLMRKRMHEQHVQELEAARKEAFENADYDKFDKVDKEIRQAEKDYVEPEPAAASQENTEEVFKDWSGENSSSG